METSKSVVGPSLPPLVDGQIRCFLHLSLGKVKWNLSKRPQNIQVRVQWWGQQTNGILLRPLSPEDPYSYSKDKISEVRYPIRCGPNQFTSYLKDMGALNLDVVYGPSLMLLGRVQITEVHHLSPDQPIKGSFPVWSITANESQDAIGSLSVSLTYRSISATFNMTSSAIPVTDTPFESQSVKSATGKNRTKKGKKGKRPSASSRKLASGDGKGVEKDKKKVVTITEAPPDRIEYTANDPLSEELSFVVGPARVSESDNHSRSPMYKLKDSNSTRFERQIIKDTELEEASLGKISHREHAEKKQQRIDVPLDIDGAKLKENASDILAALIGKGQKLREAMVISGLDLPSAKTSKERQISRESSAGKFLKEILDDAETSMTLEDISGGETSHIQETKLESKAVDLVLGKEDNIEKMLKMATAESDMSVSDCSENGDPVYDESLLADLFYTAKKDDSDTSSIVDSDISISDGNQRLEPRKPPSPKSEGNLRPKRPSSNQSRDSKVKDFEHYKPARKGKKIRKRSESSSLDESLAYLDPVVEDKDERIDHEDLAEEDGDGKKKISSTVGGLHSVVPEGMDLDKLTILGKVQFARLIVHCLYLEERNASQVNECTYFVEFGFPISTASDGDSSSFATEVIRFASKKLKDDIVYFNHRSVFPLEFNGESIERWWKEKLRFKLFTRPLKQKEAITLGTAIFPLKTVLQSDDLKVNLSLPVKLLAVDVRDNEEEIKPMSNGTSEQSHRKSIGKLEVTLELGSEKKSLQLRRKGRKDASFTKKTGVYDKVTEITADQAEFHPLEGNKLVQVASIYPANQTVKKVVTTSKEDHDHQTEGSGTKQEISIPETITLHSLLVIPCGKRVSASAWQQEYVAARTIATACNSYLVCRMFWCEEVSRTNVCWNTVDPEFKFKQVIPVLLNATLLQRTKNNFMIVEVWNKMTTAENDELIGISKLSLHQLYLSFKDRKVVETLLKSQYPVVAADDWCPVFNPFTGKKHGELKVMLALGSHDQVTRLLQLQSENAVRSLEETHVKSKSGSSNVKKPDRMSPLDGKEVEHTFEITIMAVKSFDAVGDAVWGETDCFVQYQFPDQKRPHSEACVAVFKTSTTLSVPNPVFHFTKKHSYHLPVGSAVQHYLLDSFGTESSRVPLGGIPFELWKRFYYPNIRDQLVAKTFLPLAKLCAMVTMRKTGERSSQTFALPLSSYGNHGGDNEIKSRGILEVNVVYSQNASQSEKNEGKTETRNPFVCLSVSVLRACGLKAAAKKAAKQNHRLDYASKVGLNTFVKINLSFLGKTFARTSQTIARGFAPLISYHADFPLPIINYEGMEEDQEQISLAEQLEDGHLIAEIYHEYGADSRIVGIYDSSDKPKDILVGICKIPLVGLLSHHTGIKGWFPLTVPKGSSFARDRHARCDADDFNSCVGGLELAVKFSQTSDREMVINIARGIGWSPLEKFEIHDEESWWDSENGLVAVKGLEAIVKVDKIWLPKKMLEVYSQGDRNFKKRRLYARYKFYDKSALCSKLRPFKDTDELLSCDINHKKTFLLSATSSLAWFLREEKLEVQFWLSYGELDDGLALPQNRDKLIGSSFVDLTILAYQERSQAGVSGLYPLFKPGSEYCGKACARISVALIHPTIDSNEKFFHEDVDQESDVDGQSSGYPEFEDIDEGKTESSRKHEIPKPKDQRLDVEKDVSTIEETKEGEENGAALVSVEVHIEEASHLPYVENAKNEWIAPNVYVTYQLSSSSATVYTPVIANTVKPKWHFQKTEKLTNEDIKSKEICFKIWRKLNEDEPLNSDKDIQIGTASVDLSPLAYGFRQILGWYNIHNYSGESKGQIKIGIIPPHPLSPSRSPRYFTKVQPFNSAARLEKTTFESLDLQELHDTLEKQIRIGQQNLHRLRGNERVDNNFQDLEREKSLVVPDTSRSMLMNQLRGHLSELDDLKSRLQQKLTTGLTPSSTGVGMTSEAQHDFKRLSPPSTINNGSRTVEGLVSSVSIFTDATQKDTAVTNNSDAGVPDDHDPIQSFILSIGSENEDDLNRSDTNETNSPVLLPDAETEGEAEDTQEALQDKTKEYDSFDDILKDWKHFRTGAKGGSDVEDENLNKDSWLSSDNELTSAPPYNKKTSAVDFVSNFSKDCGDEHRSSQFRSSSPQSETEIDLNKDSDNNIPQDLDSPRGIVRQPYEITNTDCEEAYVSERDGKSNQSVERCVKDDHNNMYSDPESDNSNGVHRQPETDFSRHERPQDTSSKEQDAAKLPNFFMPPDRLAETMRQLRLSKTLRHSPKTLSGIEHKEVSSVEEKDKRTNPNPKEDIKQKFERRKRFYNTEETRLRLKSNPPLNSYEVSRIASIFSSKFS